MDTREIHLDCQSLSPKDRSELLALGFYDDHFVRAGGGLTCPPFHMTWETSGTRAECAKSHEEVLSQTVALAKNSSDFVGYIEAEIITPDFHVCLPDRSFKLCQPFPLPRTQQEHTAQNKVADLHIKVPLANVSLPLESLMSGAGLYFVETPKGNRIYTIQFLDHREGKETFKRTLAFFEACGGATEITYEVCSLFIRIPESLCSPTVVKPGTLLAHYSSQ